MDRFSETISFTSLHVDRDEDGYPAVKLQCDDCGACYEAEKMKSEDGLVLCSDCLEARERREDEECQCVLIDVDLADASGCPVHGRAA